jgi:hypothetical protein
VVRVDTFEDLTQRGRRKAEADLRKMEVRTAEAQSAQRKPKSTGKIACTTMTLRRSVDVAGF